MQWNKLAAYAYASSLVSPRGDYPAVVATTANPGFCFMCFLLSRLKCFKRLSVKLKLTKFPTLCGYNYKKAKRVPIRTDEFVFGNLPKKTAKRCHFCWYLLKHGNFSLHRLSVSVQVYKYSSVEVLQK